MNIICSDKCFICKGAISNINKVAYDCSSGCTRIILGNNDHLYSFQINYWNKDIEIYYTRGLSRFDFYFQDQSADLWAHFTNKSLMFVPEIDIPKEVKDTYSLSEYLVSFAPKVNNLKHFV